MPYRVNVNDARKIDFIIETKTCDTLQEAKNVAWILQKMYQHDIVQYEEIRIMPTTLEAKG